MNKLKTISILIIPIILIFGLAPISYASISIQVNGTFQAVMIETLSMQSAGNSGIVIMDQIGESEYYGDLEATSSDSLRWVLNYANLKGTGRSVSEWTITSISGNTVSGVCTIAAMGQTDGTSVSGTWVIIKGSCTGDLVNLHGHGSFTGSIGQLGTYTGQIHFDP